MRSTFRGTDIGLVSEGWSRALERGGGVFEKVERSQVAEELEVNDIEGLNAKRVPPASLFNIT